LRKNLPPWLKSGAQLVFEGRFYHGKRMDASIRIISVLEVNSSRVKYRVKDYDVDMGTASSSGEGSFRMVEGRGESMVREFVTPLDVDICEHGWFVDCELRSIKRVKGDPPASGEAPRSLSYIGDKVIDTPFGRRKCWILKEERLKSDFRYKTLFAYDIIAKVKLEEKSNIYWSNYLNKGPLEQKYLERLVGTNFPLDQVGFLAKICPKCGSAMPSSASFCGICGERLGIS